MAAPQQGLRFSPPPLNLIHEERWLLRRAFGPAGAPCDPLDAEAACRLALRSGLAPRIAARASGETLDQELHDFASQVKAASRRALSHALAYEQVAGEISTAAQRMGQPVVFLKGFALNAARLVTAGSREVGDIDALVDPGQAEAFHARLRNAGFRAARGTSNEHHLPPLAAPGWGVVDLHFSLRGVSGTDGRWLSASQARALGDSTETHPACWVPDRRVLAAHAIAHAIEQHALSPNPYPLLRSIGDLIDLLPDEQKWAAAFPQLSAWLERTVAVEELAAMRDLCLVLQSGRIPGRIDSPAGRLLAHFLAHRFDDEYRTGLAGAHRLHRLKQAWQRRTLLRYAVRKLKGLWRRS